MSRSAVVSWARRLTTSPDQSHLRAWADGGGRIAAYTCGFVPRDLPWAAGLLPVRIGPDTPLAVLDVLVAPLACPVTGASAAGVSCHPRMASAVPIHYLASPGPDPPAEAAPAWRRALQALYEDLCRITGRSPDREALQAAIGDLNRVRHALRALYRAHRAAPETVPLEHLHLLLQAAELVAPTVFVEKAAGYLASTELPPASDPGPVLASSPLLGHVEPTDDPLAELASLLATRTAGIARRHETRLPAAHAGP